MKHLLDQLTRLAEAGKRLGGVKDIAELQESIIDLIEEIFDSATAAILLKHPRSGELRIVASRGYAPEVVESFRAGPGHGVTGTVLATGEPQLVTEIVSDPRYVRGVSDAVSEMAVPLRAGGEVIGVLDIESRQQRFSTADLALFATFGEQVVTAIRNLELQASLEARARRLVAIARVGQSLTHELDLDRLLARIVESVREALSLDTAAIMLWDAASENLVVAAATGFDRDVLGLRVPRGAGVTGRVADAGEACIIGDVSQVPHYIPGLQGCRSEMAVPLTLDGAVIGVLNVEHREAHRFDETDLLHASIFADQAARAIGNARVAEALSAARNQAARLSTRLRLLAQTTARINSSLDLDALLEQVLSLARDALGFGRIAVLLPEPSGLQLRVTREAGFDTGTTGRLIPVEGSISGAAYTTAKSQLVPDVTADPRYVKGCDGACSNVATPLVVEDDVVGVLVAETVGEDRLAEADLEVLEMLAGQVAAAIQGARRRADLAERGRRLTLIHRAACSLNATDDPEELLATILRLAQQALGLEAVAILTPDAEGNALVVRKALDHGDVEGLEIAIGHGFVGTMFVTGKAGIIDDIAAEEDYISGTPGARSEMAVPLSLDGETIGILDAESMRPFAFAPADLELFRVFGSQVATALKNARMIHALQERTRRLKLIHRAACSINTTDDPEEMLGAILRMAQQAMDLEALAILTPNAGRTALVVRKALDHGDVEGLEIPIGQGFVGSMFVTGKAGIIDDIAAEEGYISGTPGARSEMAVPLSLDGETIGILDAESMRPGAFSTADLDLFRIFGSQATTALKNARMIRDLEDRARRLTLIHKAALSLNNAEDPEEMLETILELARRALGLEAVAILTPNGDEGFLTVRKALNHGDVEGLRIPIGEGFCGSMFVTGKAGIIADIAAEEGYISGTPGARSEMAVPLSLDGETIGILDAESMRAFAFTAADLELFGVFGSQVATALNNARLIDRLRTRGRRLMLLNKASRALAAIHDPSALLDEILASAREALDLDRCALLLRDPASGELVLHAAIGYGDVLGTRLPSGAGLAGQVVASGVPRLASSEAPNVADPGYPSRCEMAAPLSVQGEAIGALATGSPIPGIFDEADLELLAAFAAQAAVAIHNARLISGLAEANTKLGENVAEMQRLNTELEAYAGQIAEANVSLESQVQRLTTLHEAGRAITSSLDLDATLKAILQMSGKIVGSTASAIKLIDEESKELMIRAEEGKVGDLSRSRTVLDLPLKIGDKTIGVFELVREAKQALGGDERQLLETMASQAAIAIENARLFEDTQRVYYETLKSLASALEARDDYTRGHSERVAEISREIATRLGMAKGEIDTIYQAALLHDIGKIGIRDEVLLAPRRLNPEELAIIQKHPTFGNTILLPLKFLGEIREYVRFHHERWDGSGYPDGRQGEDIPLASRIIAVADTYDAMTSTRPYRSALSKDTAVGEIRRSAGSQFDPIVVSTFLGFIEA
jgi:GAF domain-containing protein